MSPLHQVSPFIRFVKSQGLAVRVHGNNSPYVRSSMAATEGPDLGSCWTAWEAGR
jgi:hypothetical protein